MLANVIDVEAEMLEDACTCDFPLAVFLDFEAAFPSVDQTFLQRVLESRGWPEWFRRFAAILYDQNCCFLSLNGVTAPGFVLTAGVRQGCELIFGEYGYVSGIRLHRGKSVLVPLTLHSHEHVR